MTRYNAKAKYQGDTDQRCSQTSAAPHACRAPKGAPGLAHHTHCVAKQRRELAWCLSLFNDKRMPRHRITQNLSIFFKGSIR